MFKRIVTLFFFCLTVLLIFAENPVKRTIYVDGFDREYLVYTPENGNYDIPKGIIVCLHGFGQTMQNFFNDYNFSEIADSLNYIILTPQALPEQDPEVLFNIELINLFTNTNISLNSVWGCGLEVKSYLPLGGINIPILNEELNKNVNDVDFIASIIDNTVSEYDLDSRNIFVFGMSMGGYMSYQFALKHGDKLSGLISIAGSMGTKIKAAENPVKVPICDFHSLTDDVVPYFGSHTMSGLWVTLAKDKEDVIDYWVENNMAESPPVVENVQYYPSTNGITVEKITYPAADYEIIHYKMNGSNHSHFFTKEADCMDYKEEAIKFIQSHVSGPSDILYVKQNSTGVGDGSSWENAYPELADALLEAKTNTNIKEIWVAEGTYKPLHAADGTSDNPRNKAFVLVEGLKIYGGFPADANDTDHTSISTRGENHLLNATILSGDLKGDDTGDLTTNKSDNVYHVVIGVSIPDGETILDGFTITGGNADGDYSSVSVNGKTIDNTFGGGIFNYSSSSTLTNLTISGNTANYGGGIFNYYYSSPTFTNLTISGNTASYDGGGIYNYSSSPTLTKLTISGNTAGYGGGIFNTISSSPTLTNITISGNTATYSGGAINNNSSSPTLTNITISGNTADWGGGIYNYSSSSTLTNITISGNKASSVAGGIYNASSSPTLTNSIVWGNSAPTGNNVYDLGISNPTYNYSLVQDITTEDMNNNLDGSLDPLFVDWIDPSGDSWTATGGDNYRLKSASPLIDKGDNKSYETARGLIPSSDIDLDGNPRLSGESIDLGAYEFSGLTWTGLAGNNWTEPGSWNTGEVPNATLSVYIPGNLDTYPVLTAADAGVAAVKDIRFEAGAEIGRQDLLSYEKAYVQLDFNEASSRNRWYMLSNPLQQLYAGDFSFGGYPGMDMKLFQMDEEQDNKTVWKRITGLNQSFSTGNGFIVWLAPDKPDWKENKGLKLSKGILELPYFDNTNVPADVHWTHNYTAPYSTFTGWKEENGSIVENKDTPETAVLRNNEAYRLAGQTVEEPINFGEGHFAIAGNPYMSSIDFDILYNANNSLIGATYQIWIGPGGSSGGSYAGYNAIVSSSFGALYSIGIPYVPELDKNIAPMQSFIVEKSNTNTFTGEQEFSFDLSDIGVTGVKTRLRSDAPQGDKLDIVASTAQAGIRTVIVSRQAGGSSLGSADSRKLFGEINNNPEVYTLKSAGANNKQVATAVNVLGEITGETLVPLAISTTYNGELSFTFTGMDTYNARISLLDTETGTEIELTDKAQYEYKFDYVPEQSGGKTLANENRFFIRLNKSLTDIEEIASEAIRIYAPHKGTLQVVSTHPLRQVRVYNLQGSLVYNTSAIQANTQKVEGLAAGVYIVKAVSGNTVTTEKVIVR